VLQDLRIEPSLSPNYPARLASKFPAQNDPDASYFVEAANVALEACIGSPFDDPVTLVSCVCYRRSDNFGCSLFDVDCLYLYSPAYLLKKFAHYLLAKGFEIEPFQDNDPLHP
jgi:hypothetical protein